MAAAVQRANTGKSHPEMKRTASCVKVSLLTYLAILCAAGSLMSWHHANCLHASLCLLFHTMLNCALMHVFDAMQNIQFVHFGLSPHLAEL